MKMNDDIDYEKAEDTYRNFVKDVNKPEYSQLHKYRLIITKLYEFWAYDGITKITTEQYDIMNDYIKLGINDNYTRICEDIINDCEIIEPFRKNIL